MTRTPWDVRLSWLESVHLRSSIVGGKMIPPTMSHEHPVLPREWSDIMFRASRVAPVCQAVCLSFCRQLYYSRPLFAWQFWPGN